MGVLLQGNFRRHAPVTLTKVQLGRHPQVRRSKSWIEERMREGMPSRMDDNRRIFDLDECLEWLENRRSGGEPQSSEAPPVDPPDAADAEEAESGQPPDAVA